jgi:hypothetical protein
MNLDEKPDEPPKSYDPARNLLLYPLCFLGAGPCLFLLSSLFGNRSISILSILSFISIALCLMLRTKRGLSQTLRDCAMYFLAGTIAMLLVLLGIFIFLMNAMQGFHE